MDPSTTKNANLHAFLSTAKAHGITDTFIVTLLKENGWPERAIYRAFSIYYEETLKIALPKHSINSENARDAFYYLLNFITLGFWTIALGTLCYKLTSWWFPDLQTNFHGTLQDSISWPVATLLVTFPIFLYIHRLIHHQLRIRPDLYDSAIRKWLTYIALIVSAFVVICDGIWFLQTFLSGEIAISFVLHAASLFIIGGGVFSYYLLTMNPPVQK